MGRHAFYWLVILFVAVIVLAGPRQVGANGLEVEQWHPVEITLNSTSSYINPYLDVDVTAVFQGPGGIQMAMPGFWDGGSSWRIRFSPPVAGEWTYETSATDPNNAGLHHVTGSFAATEYLGGMDIYKHGFLKPSANNRYVTYGDGTPFFWLGDTHWMGLSGRERLEESNDARYMSQFKGMADKRKEQGYNVYAMTLFGGSWGDVSPAGTYNEGGPVWYDASLSTSHSSAVAPAAGGDHRGSKKAVDGNEETRWQASSAAYPQWMELDLGTVRTVAGLDIAFGTPDTWSYVVEGSADRIRYTTLVDNSDGVIGQEFAAPVSADIRYLRVTVIGAALGAIASITELTPYDHQHQPLNNSGLFQQLNPYFWQNVDERLAYLSDQGFVSALGLDWGRNLEAANESGYMRLARYVVARYGAYPVVWLGAGEYATGNSASWGRISSYIYDIDPYKRLNFLHNAVWNPDQFRDQPWYQMDYLQAGHGSLKAKPYWLDHYNELPARIILEGEANYENINGIPTKYTREIAWNALVSGSAGFTYGAEGIWQATWDSIDNWQVWNASPTPWYEAVLKPGGEQMRFLKDFFTALPWWTLAPDAGVIEWNGAPPLTDKSAPYQLSNPDRSVVVAYLPSYTGTYTGKVKGLSGAAAFRAQWFNTRNGEYITIADAIAADSAGEWAIPAQPGAAEDWALLIVRTSERAAQPVPDHKGDLYSMPVTVSLAADSVQAAVYYTLDGSVPGPGRGNLYASPIVISADSTLKAVAIEEGLAASPVAVEYYRFSGNLNLKRKYSGSTSYDGVQVAGKAFDGISTTNWQAANNARNDQWLEVDFGQFTTFNRAALSEYGNRTKAYRIEYWNGQSWQTAYTGTTIGADLGDRVQVEFPEVTGSKARFYVVSATLQPIIYEFELYHVPTGLTATPGQGQIGLSWNQQPGAASYSIRRSHRSGGPYQTIAAGVTSASYTDAGLGNSAAYYYVIASVNQYGMEKGASHEVFAVTPEPRALTLNQQYAASSSFNSNQTAEKGFDGLSSTNWQAAVGKTAGQWLEVDFGRTISFGKAVLSEYGNRTTGFRIEYWTGAEWQTAYTGTTIGPHAGAPLTVYFPEATGSKARIYFTSAASQPIIYEFQLFRAPSELLGVSSGSTTADLSWTAVSGASSYTVKRSMYPAGPYTAVAAGLSSTNYRDTGLLEGAIYYYCVSAWTGDGESDHSQIVSVTTAGQLNYAYGKVYRSSSDFAAAQSAAMAFDGSVRTNWQAAAGRFAGEWLEVDFGTTVAFNKIKVSEYGSRTAGFRIEYWDGDSYETAYTGTTIGSSASSPLTAAFPPVAGSKARIYFTSGISQPIIYEFGIYNE
jgi:hypothetical protein